MDWRKYKVSIFGIINLPLNAVSTQQTNIFTRKNKAYKERGEAKRNTRRENKIMNKFQQPPPFQNTILRKSYIVGICHFPNKINKRMKMVLPFLLLLVLVSLPKIYWMVIMLQHCITSFTLGSACPVSGKSSETTTGIDFLLHF